MRKSEFTEEEMVKILRETDRHSVADVAKKHGISEPTIYAWRRRFGAMTADDAKRLKQLESENSKLKRIVADQLLAIDVLRDINAKKW